jgi:molybdopterin-guanine dinucleotide biosynthesis protein A
VLAQDRVRASYMECDGNWHPALCLVHQECLEIFREALECDDRKLTRIFRSLGDRLLVLDAVTLWPDAERCFANVNTPEELAAAERMQY